MLGHRFTKFLPSKSESIGFDQLLDIFLQILNITSGNVSEALNLLNKLDRKYSITKNGYGIGDFIEELKEKGFISDDNHNGNFSITSKSEKEIRRRSLEEIFGKLKKSGRGHHRSTFSGMGDEKNADRRSFQFGDSLDQIDLTSSIKNAQINHGINDFRLTEEDLEIEEMDYKTSSSTVLMIDISHSMILYGEDRISPAKKVAMALAELITTKYPSDTLDILTFGDDAKQIQIKDLPYLNVGPFHTNTVAGLEMAMDILRKKKNKNKQIFMITDGKPTCLKIGIKYYKNSFGLDSKIVNKTLDLAARCKKLGIQITTFMIARDSYLQQFVREFTKTNQGKAYYSSLNNLGEFVFEDYVRNRRKKMR
jgi:uncharacterized protein with von Willebrand factor type A (vWA) domain